MTVTLTSLKLSGFLSLVFKDRLMLTLRYLSVILVVAIALLIALIYLIGNVKPRQSSPEFYLLGNEKIYPGKVILPNDKKIASAVGTLSDIDIENETVIGTFQFGRNTRQKVIIYSKDFQTLLSSQRTLDFSPVSKDIKNAYAKSSAEAVSSFNRLKNQNLIVIFLLDYDGISEKLLECNRSFIENLQVERTLGNCKPISFQLSAYAP